MKTVVSNNQMTLWHEMLPQRSNVQGLQFARNTDDESGELRSESINLMPLSSKDESVTTYATEYADKTAAERKALRRAKSVEMKRHLLSMATDLQANDKVGFQKVHMTKNRVALVYQVFPEQVQMITDEQIAARMGQTVAWVQKHIRKTAPLIDAGTGKELKPAPQNGVPELQPKKRGGKKTTPKAPEAPQAPQAPARQ